jgi:hypothetical protein
MGNLTVPIFALRPHLRSVVPTRQGGSDELSGDRNVAIFGFDHLSPSWDNL